MAFFWKVGFLSITCRFLNFMIIRRKETQKQLANYNKRTMGCVVLMNTDLIGQSFLRQKIDHPSKKEKQWNAAYFFIKCCEPCRKNEQILWTIIEQTRNWQAWHREGKMCRHVSSCPNANSSLWNRCLYWLRTFLHINSKLQINSQITLWIVCLKILRPLSFKKRSRTAN